MFNNGAAVATATTTAAMMSNNGTATATTTAATHPPLVKCFHCTSPSAAQSILATQFNKPTKQEGRDRGLKMGT